MSKENVEHIIRKFGSQQRVAELLGIWQTAVSGWVRRGAIPARRQEELLAAARREGVDLAPADFFGVTEQADGTTGMAVPQRLILPTPSTTAEQGPRTPMTSSTAEVIELRKPAVSRTGAKDLYEVGEIPPLGHVPRNMYAWAIRRERQGEPDQRHAAVEVVPTHEIGDDECLVMVMAAGVNYNGVWAALGKPVSPVRRPQAALPHRRLRRVGHRLGGGLEGEALEGRRRGRHPLQPGRRRRRGVQRRRADVLALPAHLGLRDAGRLLRPVLPRAVAPADAAAAAPHLGGVRAATS